jgi:hypothetical protein
MARGPLTALALAASVVLTAGSTMSCAASLPSAPSAPAIVLPLPDVAADVWGSRGDVLVRAPFDPPLDDPESVLGESWRAVYASVSGVDGGARQVSGSFFIPRGRPPPNGWPVISLAHATTGIDNGCAPSTDPDLKGYLSAVRTLVAQGYAVALSDYEGLADSGSHPFMEPRTAAFNVIDAVRALREIFPSASPRWVAFGSSQGGQAAWAANELNSYYGDGIELLGSAVLAPGVNITGVANLAWVGWMTDEQESLYPFAIVGLERYNADLDERAFLRGRVAADMRVLAQCQSPVQEPGSQSAAADLKPNTLQDVARLRDALRRIALPQRQLDKPMLVVNGLRDETVLAPWVAYAVSQSCRLGGQIEHVEIPDAGHADVSPETEHTVRSWIADRFDGLPPPSNCAT